MFSLKNFPSSLAVADSTKETLRKGKFHEIIFNNSSLAFKNFYACLRLFTPVSQAKKTSLNGRKENIHNNLVCI